MLSDPGKLTLREGGKRQDLHQADAILCFQLVVQQSVWVLLGFSGLLHGASLSDSRLRFQKHKVPLVDDAVSFLDKLFPSHVSHHHQSQQMIRTKILSSIYSQPMIFFHQHFENSSSSGVSMCLWYYFTALFILIWHPHIDSTVIGSLTCHSHEGLRDLNCDTRCVHVQIFLVFLFRNWKLGRNDVFDLWLKIKVKLFLIIILRLRLLHNSINYQMWKCNLK